MNAMHLKVLLPSEIFLDAPVRKIVAEAENGSFCLLPRHVDFVAALVPGLLTYVDENEQEIYLAVDEGILVKCGHRVNISTRNAVRDADLEKLQATVQNAFRRLDEHERTARSVLARLEAGVVRQFTQLNR